MVEKEPLTQDKFIRLQESAINYPNPDAIKVIQLIRYGAGMHISVICDPLRNDLHIEERPKGKYIVWNRPKKSGRVAHTHIKQSRNITFNVAEWIEDLKDRRARKEADPKPRGKKYRITREYFNKIIHKVGDRAGIKGISPLTLRHTFGVQSLSVLGPDLTRQKMNCSPRTFKTYSRYDMDTEEEIYLRVNW